MKLLAVFFAVVIWGFVMIETNPDRIKTISDIEITLRNEGMLREAGLVLIQPTLPKVTVSLEVRQSDYASTNIQNINVVADLANITKAGSKVRVRLDVTTRVGSVRSVTPQYIDLDIDTWEQMDIPVMVNVTGTLPQGYWKGKPEVDPTIIKVEGPRSQIESLKQAVVNVSVDNVTDVIHDMSSVILIGQDGDEIIDSQLRTAQSLVQVRLPIYPTARVAIRDIDNPGNPYPVRVLGQPAEGYEVKSVEVTPEAILIAGPGDILEQIQGLYVEPVFLDGEQNNLQFILKPLLPEGVQCVDEQDIMANVTLGEIITEKEYDLIGVIMQGRSSMYDYVIDTDTVNVVLANTYLTLNALNLGSELFAYVDVANLQPGTYTLPIQLQDDSNSIVESITPGEATVTVSLALTRR